MYSRKNKIITATTSLALVASGIGFIAPPAYSADASPKSSNSACPSSAAENSKSTTNMSQISGEEASGLVAKVSAGLKSGRYETHAGLENLDFKNAKVYSVTSGDKIYKSVTVPMSDKYATTSNITVLFDHNSSVNYSETLYSKGDAGKFHLSKYNNGKLAQDKNTSIDYKTNSQIKSDSKNNNVSTGATTYKSTGDKVACVASVLGVSGVVGYLIVGACAGACAAGETGVTIPVCVACIGGYATVGGASVTAVASCFN